eukprot:m.60659 g.60659  ORF g.60659 m.60659 type:complete len:57 (-) comp7956_c0_seq1:3328-3498(-)
MHARMPTRKANRGYFYTQRDRNNFFVEASSSTASNCLKMFSALRRHSLVSVGGTAL